MVKLDEQNQNYEVKNEQDKEKHEQETNRFAASGTCATGAGQSREHG
jgi:hypothetical protein